MENPGGSGRGFDHPSVDKYIDEIHYINVSIFAHLGIFLDNNRVDYECFKVCQHIFVSTSLPQFSVNLRTMISTSVCGTVTGTR